jgi:hypothetical protein
MHKEVLFVFVGLSVALLGLLVVPGRSGAGG